MQKFRALMLFLLVLIGSIELQASKKITSSSKDVVCKHFKGKGSFSFIDNSQLVFHTISSSGTPIEILHTKKPGWKGKMISWLDGFHAELLISEIRLQTGRRYTGVIERIRFIPPRPIEHALAKAELFSDKNCIL